MDKFDIQKKNKTGRAPRCKECLAPIYSLVSIKNKDKRSKQAKERRQTKEGKAIVLKAVRKYQEKYPEKHAARAAVKRALKDGRLVRMPCEECGEKVTHGHHPDYSKQLEVKWLCIKHHYEQHRKYKK